jgi:hypothetical protein
MKCATPPINPGYVIPGRHRRVASPESITFGLWLWIPGSLLSRRPGMTENVVRGMR